MIAISGESLERDRVDCVPADQRFNVLHVAVFRVLGAGARPQQPLGAGTLAG